MKKVGIAANHNIINYGTMLQALAMQTAIERLGCTAETIDFTGLANDIRKKKLRYFNREFSKLELLKAKGPTLRKMGRRITDHKFRDKLKTRERVFAQFRKEHFPMSPACCSREALTGQARSYDTVLIGSDQVWLPSNIAGDVLTLSFVPDEINKVSYASSFGVSELPQSQHAAAASFLGRIDHISVREQSGQRIVSELTGREAELVCDPTLLFDAKEWEKIIPRHTMEEQPYIFCYLLGNNPWQRAFVKEVRRLTGLKIIMPLHMDDYIRSDTSFADTAPYTMGPEEFLNYIRNADYVFTDSFHGTIFSILHNRNFFTFNRFTEGAVLSTNTRIDSLFSITGLHARRIGNDARPADCINTGLSNPYAGERIGPFREHSWNYLSKALGLEQHD